MTDRWEFQVLVDVHKISLQCIYSVNFGRVNMFSQGGEKAKGREEKGTTCRQPFRYIATFQKPRRICLVDVIASLLAVLDVWVAHAVDLGRVPRPFPMTSLVHAREHKTSKVPSRGESHRDAIRYRVM